MTLEEIKTAIKEVESNWRLTIAEAKEHYKKELDKLNAQKEALEKTD